MRHLLLLLLLLLLAGNLLPAALGATTLGDATTGATGGATTHGDETSGATGATGGATTHGDETSGATGATGGATTHGDETSGATGATGGATTHGDETSGATSATEGATTHEGGTSGATSATEGATTPEVATTGATGDVSTGTHADATSGATGAPTSGTPGDASTGTPGDTAAPTTRDEATGTATTRDGTTGTPTTRDGTTGAPTTRDETTSAPTTRDGTTGAPTSRDAVTTRPPTVTDTPAPTTQTETTSQPTLPPSSPYEVTTPYGTFMGTTYARIRGFSDRSRSDERAVNVRQISRFLGIPYAQPPVESRRFRAPAPVARSNETFNATEMKPSCPQGALRQTSEDCLHYNVWTPQTAENETARYPVIVWIHGGRFEVGGSDDGLTEGEEIVLHQDVVVVTFNYRLGSLGFLTLNDTDIAGNYGILDQRLAIRVISEVIPSFGGDSSKITLMGLDAGSASIGFHMMDANTSSRFSRVIMMGGSPMMPWSLTPVTDFVQSLSFLFATNVGCAQSNRDEQRRCLEAVDVNRLIDTQVNFTRLFRGLEFLPIIDGSTIVGDPWGAFSNGNFNGKEVLLGATNDEGANLVDGSLADSSILLENLDDARLVQLLLGMFDFYPRTGQQLSGAGREFLRLHFTNRGGNSVGSANFKILSDAVGDWYLTCPVTQMARFAESKTRNVFMYYFTEGEILQDRWQGASHGEDAKYAFGIPTKDVGIVYPPEKKALSERLMRNFVRFADTGVPETDERLWKALNHSGGEVNYINYNSNAAQLGNRMFGFRGPQCHFWNTTLAYVSGLREQVATTAATTASATSPEAEQSTTATTGRPPIGPTCAWAFTESSATILAVLLVALLATSAALVYFVLKWRSLAKVGASQPVAMTQRS